MSRAPGERKQEAPRGWKPGRPVLRLLWVRRQLLPGRLPAVRVLRVRLPGLFRGGPRRHRRWLARLQDGRWNRCPPSWWWPIPNPTGAPRNRCRQEPQPFPTHCFPVRRCTDRKAHRAKVHPTDLLRAANLRAHRRGRGRPRCRRRWLVHQNRPRGVGGQPMPHSRARPGCRKPQLPLRPRALHWPGSAFRELRVPSPPMPVLLPCRNPGWCLPWIAARELMQRTLLQRRPMAMPRRSWRRRWCGAAFRSGRRRRDLRRARDLQRSRHLRQGAPVPALPRRTGPLPGVKRRPENLRPGRMPARAGYRLLGPTHPLTPSCHGSD